MRLNSLQDIIRKLNRLLTKRHKGFLFILFLFTLLLSVIETIAVSVIMPFISVVSNPTILENGIYKKVFDFLKFTNKNHFISAFGFIIIIFYIFRLIYNIGYTYISNKLSLGMFRYFASSLFKTYTALPYKIYTQKNSSKFTQAITSEANSVSILLQNLVNLLSEAFTVLVVYGIIFLMEWRITLALSVILAIAVLCIMFLITSKAKQQGIKRTEGEQKLYKQLNETFGNFKFIRLKGNDIGMLRAIDLSTEKVTRSRVSVATLSVIPRNILESFGFSLLIGVVLFILWRDKTAVKIIPIIMMYALAFYRILPAISRMLSYYSNIIYFKRSLDVIYDDIYQEKECEGNDPVFFEKSIKVKSLSFRYVDDKKVLDNISFEIQKGEKIAITGKSGSGKTTLVDILIGVHKPTSGVIYVDDVPVSNKNIRSWRTKIGYIPQDIYLFDGTVTENVVFGAKPDENRIIEVLKMANIWEFLAQKNGLKSWVGEGGIQLSGGQKQRIGIARALYCNPDVLVLDEATSALDNETESKIMDEIYSISGNRTLVVVAHRLTTVERCDRRIKIENGMISKI